MAEIEERHAAWQADGFTVAERCGITTVSYGSGPEKIFLVTRLQPQETSGTFMVDGMLRLIKARGLPEEFTFICTIVPDPDRVASGPSEPQPRFAPDGPTAAEQNLRALMQPVRDYLEEDYE